MSIGAYIKEIGRGKAGARALSREHAHEVLGRILDGYVTDLELGAFCIAMRVKGETPQEMLGFLDAVQSRSAFCPLVPEAGPAVVIPSYNGARKLPGLTPLLALLLARADVPVLVHGSASEGTRVFTAEVFAALDVPPQSGVPELVRGRVAFVPTQVLSAGLQRLLDVRRVLQLRNPAHSLVKLLRPCAGPSVLVTSYTHPEYAESMAQTLEHLGANALLLRGTEGEPVADARRRPRMQSFIAGQAQPAQEADAGVLTSLPALPAGCAAEPTAQYIREVLRGALPVPAPIASQVSEVLRLVAAAA